MRTYGRVRKANMFVCRAYSHNRSNYLIIDPDIYNLFMYVYSEVSIKDTFKINNAEKLR